MNEKQRIEQATALGFLVVYNATLRTDFKIIELRDSPDVVCMDSAGNKMNLEITLTEDRYGDIQDSLGRANHRSAESVSKHLANVRNGKEVLQFSSLQGNVLNNAVARIKEKLLNRYGPDTALVVRDTSGVDWDWDTVLNELKDQLNGVCNSFDRGIWIINNSKTKIYHVL